MFLHLTRMHSSIDSRQLVSSNMILLRFSFFFQHHRSHSSLLSSSSFRTPVPTFHPKVKHGLHFCCKRRIQQIVIVCIKRQGIHVKLIATWLLIHIMATNFRFNFHGFSFMFAQFHHLFLYFSFGVIIPPVHSLIFSSFKPLAFSVELTIFCFKAKSHCFKLRARVIKCVFLFSLTTKDTICLDNTKRKKKWINSATRVSLKSPQKRIS